MTKPIKPELVGPALPVERRWPLSPAQTTLTLALPAFFVSAALFNLGMERVLPNSLWVGWLLIWLSFSPFVAAWFWATRHMPPLAGGMLASWAAGGVVLGVAYLLIPAAPASDTSVSTNHDQRATETALPDVVMHLSRKKSPAVSLANPSSVVAEQIKWSVIVCNLDDPATVREDGSFVPLPIPFTSFDFLRPGSGTGLMALFENTPAGAKVKPGDELFGFSQVTCPRCARDRYYWVFMKFGESGWYAEATQNQDVLAPIVLVEPVKKLMQQGADRESLLADIVPVEKRIAFP